MRKQLGSYRLLLALLLVTVLLAACRPFGSASESAYPARPATISVPVASPTSASTVAPTATQAWITATPTQAHTPLPTGLSIATRTPRPTGTSTPLPTNTARPKPSETPLPAPTNTPVPKSTHTPIPVPTNSPVPDRSESALTVRTLGTSQKVAALTFDAGADVGYAAQILDTLAANGIRADFGMTGKWAEANLELVKRMAREGHHFINHTWSHRSFTGHSTGEAPLTYKERADELWRTHRLLLKLTGASTKPYWRPPYGDYDESVLRDVWSRGYSYNVLWTVDSLGWKGLKKDRIVQRCLDGLQPGAIYLLHVGSQSQDGPALQTLIDELRARGYTFASVSEYYG